MGEPEEKKKLDLSVAQVAGSSLATVAAAVLAQGLGVYGTIIGAGVVSVVATAGGPVIGHFFRRTGGQLRETARPKSRQVPVVDGAEATTLLPVHGGDPTTVLPVYGADPTTVLPVHGADPTTVLPVHRADATTVLPVAGPPGAAPDEEFSRATTHGTTARGWKRTAVAAGSAFAIALGGIAAYEGLSGRSVSDRPLYTAVTGSSGDSGRKQDPPAAPDGQRSPGTGERRHDEEPAAGSSPSPSRSHGGRDPSPDPSPSHSTGPTPSPDPSRSAGPTPTPSKPTPTPEKSTPTAGQGGASPS
ncbi:hypothetical protein OHS33_27645 [Streptomyces sp. NBC_00536]|uniref:hypothetical protein n=1 Tax=Streptomyces sp. NBC_00536 TaxID=2975769 RepID=UPI002E806072|nr:hypothetical protein [Streptomyces sp. NBC_00536]WUC81780.1 hypothetical protein OHS33_27645 [Streptomyces sp. NBC_00536]